MIWLRGIKLRLTWNTLHFWTTARTQFNRANFPHSSCSIAHLEKSEHRQEWQCKWFLHLYTCNLLKVLNFYICALKLRIRRTMILYCSVVIRSREFRNCTKPINLKNKKELITVLIFLEFKNQYIIVIKWCIN